MKSSLATCREDRPCGTARRSRPAVRGSASSISTMNSSLPVRRERVMDRRDSRASRRRSSRRADRRHEVRQRIRCRESHRCRSRAPPLGRLMRSLREASNASRAAAKRAKIDEPGQRIAEGVGLDFGDRPGAILAQRVDREATVQMIGTSATTRAIMWGSADRRHAYDHADRENAVTSVSCRTRAPAATGTDRRRSPMADIRDVHHRDAAGTVGAEEQLDRSHCRRPRR